MEKKQEHMRQLLRMVNVYKDAMEHYDRTSKKFPVEGLDYQMLKRPSIFFLNQSRKKDEATGGEKAGSSRKRKAVDGEEKEGEGKEKKDKKEKKKTQKNNEEGMKSGDVVSSVPNKQKKESKRGVAGKDDKVGIVEQASDPMNSVLSTEVERVNKRRLEKEGDNSKFEDRKKKSIVVTAVAVTSEEVLETAVGEEEEALAEVLETAVGGEEEALTEVLEMAVGEEEEALTEVLETAVGEEEEAPAEMLTGKVVSVAVGEFMCEEDFRELFRAVHVQLYIIAKEDSFAYTVLDNDAATTLHRRLEGVMSRKEGTLWYFFEFCRSSQGTVHDREIELIRGRVYESERDAIKFWDAVAETSAYKKFNKTCNKCFLRCMNRVKARSVTDST